MLRLALFLAALLLQTPAWAADAGGYIGAAIGVSDSPARCEEDLARRCEGNLFGLRGFLGYAFNRTLAVEAGLVGVAASSDSNGGALDLSGIASMPLRERVALFGRLGVITAGGSGDLAYGAGLRFDVEEKTALRVEWQHYGSSGGIDFLFVGLQRRF